MKSSEEYLRCLPVKYPEGEEDQVTVSCCSSQWIRRRESGARTMYWHKCGIRWCCFLAPRLEQLIRLARRVPLPFDYRLDVMLTGVDQSRVEQLTGQLVDVTAVTFLALANCQNEYYHPVAENAVDDPIPAGSG
jgi:hypothetical protein